MEELRTRIENEFQWKIIEMEAYRQLWKVTTVDGKWILKSYSLSNHLNWIHYLNQQLHQKGFNRFPFFKTDKNESPYLVWQDKMIVAMPYIEGRSARYSDISDINKVISVLGIFHHHASFIESKVKPPIRKLIYDKYSGRLERFKYLYSQLQFKTNKSDIDRHLLLLGREMIKYGTFTLHHLDTRNVDWMQEEAITHHIVSHRDVASHNFLINNKQAYIIDFDLAGFEPQVFDLLQLTQRIMVEKKWDLEVFQHIISQYETVRKLRPNERSLLYQLSLFPNEFLREVLGVYEYPEKFNKKYVLKLLEKYLSHYEQFQAFQIEINKARLI